MRGEEARLARVSKEYLRPGVGRSIDKKMLASVVRALLPWVAGPDVLEMGWGDGEWTRHLIRRFKRSFLVDAAPPLLERARRLSGRRLTTYESLFETFSPGRRFDTVLASFVLEHVEDPRAVLKRAGRWLKGGGRIIVVVPHADSLHRRLAVRMGLQRETSELGQTDLSLGHRRVYTLARLEADVRAAGLVARRRQGLIVKPLPWSMMAHLPERMLEGFAGLGGEAGIGLCATLALDCRRKGEP